MNGKKKSHIELDIRISADAAKGLDPQDIADALGGVGKDKKDSTTVGRKVIATVVTSK